MENKKMSTIQISSEAKEELKNRYKEEVGEEIISKGVSYEDIIRYFLNKTEEQKEAIVKLKATQGKESLIMKKIRKEQNEVWNKYGVG